MAWYYVIPLLVVGAVAILFLVRNLKGGLLLSGANTGINEHVQAAKSALEQRGFSLVMEWPGSFMDGALSMRRDGEVTLHFALGRRAIHQDSVDMKLLGRGDRRLLSMWWLQLAVELPDAERFPTFAMCRRHQGTDAAWGFLKPKKKWSLAQHTTGDARFDELFEILVEPDLRDREVIDEASRTLLLSLSQEPYFDNLIFLCPPHAPRWLIVVNPPLPSEGTGSVEVIEGLAERLRTVAKTPA